MVSRSAHASLRGMNYEFYNSAKGFDQVMVYATAGGNDRGTFSGMLGSESIVGYDSMAQLNGNASTLQAFGLDVVFASAKAGEQPAAELGPVDYVFKKLGAWL